MLSAYLFPIEIRALYVNTVKTIIVLNLNKLSICHEKNRNVLTYLMKITFLISFLSFITFGTLIYFIASLFMYDDLVRDIIFSIVLSIILLFLSYWLYLTILSIKEKNLVVTKIIAVSKDGYETEISRVQSKRNLFKFIKTYFVKETNFVTHPEEFWWKRSIFHKRKFIEESFQQFILNAGPQQEQEDFAYEGIFDKNDHIDKSPMRMKGARVDQNFMNTLNRSNLGLDEYKLPMSPMNGSNIILNHEDISDQSPNSAASNPYGKNRYVKGTLIIIFTNSILNFFIIWRH